MAQPTSRSYDSYHTQAVLSVCLTLIYLSQFCIARYLPPSSDVTNRFKRRHIGRMHSPLFHTRAYGTGRIPGLVDGGDTNLNPPPPEFLIRALNMTITVELFLLN